MEKNLNFALSNPAEDECLTPRDGQIDDSGMNNQEIFVEYCVNICGVLIFVEHCVNICGVLCEIHYGPAVEDSDVLPLTFIGFPH